ncbi:Redoxin domain protein [Crinalium epipsammum PCC 9333]|uniref:Redoxin domain protein n=1 Tax=Crinalium epipsammum PCC 9333 TaxID=1173022 RepID=K9W4J0_9CYAN|nr:thioredoxin family protein [Crinalium epipsammum]AFZ14370.1 Redoxin domain protein [Crinalium epipsammum PCC 9333]
MKLNENLLQRRQFISYFGLGIGTVALSLGFKKATTPTSAFTADAVPNSTSIAASPTKEYLPEFQGLSQWLNSTPLKVTDLKNQVVLVQFWAFACINCQRTLPYITRWHRQYAAQGLKVIGIHTPEFPFERDVNNVKKALKRHKITYPVALDNEYKTWNAYHNNYWPHLFLADRQGFLRYDHIGEGAYQETEQLIKKLLG